MEMVTYLFPQREENKNYLFSCIGLADPDTGKFYTYLIGYFPVTSDRGIQYILILYAYGTNSVLVEPIKTIIDTYMVCSYDVLYDTLENSVHASKLNIMDNEAPAARDLPFTKKENSGTTSSTV